MKKLSLVLAAVCSLGAVFAAGCGGGATQSVYSVNGFEKYDELRTIRMERCIGSIKVNRDEKFVTDGEASAKFEIVKPSALAANGWITGSLDTGVVEKNVTPCLTFAATSDYNKINEIAEFTLDVYSKNEFDCKLLFTAENKFNQVVFADVIDVTGGQWNKIRIPVSGHFYETETEVADYNVSFYGAPKAIFYLDAFKIVKGAREKAAVTDRAVGSILDFDSASDLAYLNYVCNTKTPSVQYTHSPDYAFAQNGYSLKLKAFETDGSEYEKSDDTDAACRAGNGFSIAPELLQKCDTSFAEKILLDVFVDANQTRNIVITASDGETVQTQSFPVSGYQWTTVEFESKFELSKLASLQIKLDTLANETECDVYLDDLRYV